MTETRREYGRIRVSELQSRDLLEYLLDAQQRLLSERAGLSGPAKELKTAQLGRLRRTLDELQRTMTELGWMDPDDPWYGQTGSEPADQP